MQAQDKLTNPKRFKHYILSHIVDLVCRRNIIIFETFLYEAVRVSLIIGGNIFQGWQFGELFPE